MLLLSSEERLSMAEKKEAVEEKEMTDFDDHDGKAFVTWRTRALAIAAIVVLLFVVALLGSLLYVGFVPPDPVKKKAEFERFQAEEIRNGDFDREHGYWKNIIRTKQPKVAHKIVWGDELICTEYADGTHGKFKWAFGRNLYSSLFKFNYPDGRCEHRPSSGDWETFGIIISTLSFDNRPVDERVRFGKYYLALHFSERNRRKIK